jgi:hypothetical protein
MRKTQNTYKEPEEFDITRKSYQLEFFNFIEEKISLFPSYISKSFDFQNLPNTIQGENKITEQFHRFLSTHVINYKYNEILKSDFYHFIFENQSSGERHRSYDIGVILGKETHNTGKILVIEAKRLPTPGNARKKEYLFGNLGAVERFRKEVHGQDVKSDQAIIIGYIQNENQNYWLQQINSWIDEENKDKSESSLTWHNIDKFVKDDSFSQIKISKFISEHSRITLEKIKLYHYWVDLIS